MAATPTASAPDPATAAASGPSLRVWGVVIFVLFVLTSAIGGSLALESSYVSLNLASHVGLALVTLGIAGYASSFVGRSYRPLPRASAGIAALAALAATIAGTIFLVDGQGTRPSTRWRALHW